jgi:glycosyltransferase involved in cell wall biosynthesis
MPKISVIIITRNEERNIGRCLDSIKDLADDIVVVDSYSTDRTEEICRNKGARFFQHPFIGHIEQKRYAATLSEFPHILSLDADEALDDKLKNSIREAKENWKYDGYEMSRLTNYCGTWIKHCGWYPDRKLRLFDKRKGKWGGINPHDKIEMEPGSVTGRLKGDILHYSYYTIDDHYKQIEYFTTINAKASFDKGKRAPLWKLYLSPVFKFIQHYFIRLGFLDGQAGWQICRLSAWATYLKYKKMRMLIKNA